MFVFQKLNVQGKSVENRKCRLLNFVIGKDKRRSGLGIIVDRALGV